jgi:ankyrin repeat protein
MDVSGEDWFEREQPHRAAAEGNLVELQRLVAEGHRVDTFDEQHMTPLHHAADQGRVAVAQWLLAQGADVNAHDEQNIGETALAIAVKRGQLEVAELLLKRGANPDIPGWMGQTARTRAEKAPDTALAALFAKFRRT